MAFSLRTCAEKPVIPTIQFVAVMGIREKSHPDWPCMSDVRRIYLQSKTSDLAFRLITDRSVLTDLLVRWCLPRTQSIDFAYQNQDMAAEAFISNILVYIHTTCPLRSDAPSKDD